MKGGGASRPELRAGFNYILFLSSISEFMEQYMAKLGMPDLIHGHSLLTGGYIAMLVAQILKLPLVVTEHGPSTAHCPSAQARRADTPAPPEGPIEQASSDTWPRSIARSTRCHPQRSCST